MQRSRDPFVGFETDRIKTLADGIFAFAMTLLVLDLRDLPASGLAHRAHLALLLPRLFAYAISFMILGLFWTGHQAEFHYIKRTTRLHLWINIVLLMVVALIPFSAGLLAGHGATPFAVAVYAVNLVAINAAYWANWVYATSGHRLVESTLDPRIISDVKRRILSSTVLLVGALLLALWSATVSFVVYVIVQVLFIAVTTRTTTGAPPGTERAT